MKINVIVVVFLLALITLVNPARAHQLVLSFGYANSGTPETGSDVSADNTFAPGGGVAFGTRVDLEREYFWFGPAFTFWNNLTGDPNPNANSSYFQAELGGRISARTRTVPTIYGGVGAGYTFSHGEHITLLDGSKQTYDGDFPTGSAHFGVKTPSRTYGVGLIGEASYHFGLGEARGRDSVGPARAFVIQIGFAFDIRLAGDQPSRR